MHTDFKDFGCKTLTWPETDAFCKDLGGRLCTQMELENDCTAGTGCGYDAFLVWSSNVEDQVTLMELDFVLYIVVDAETAHAICADQDSIELAISDGVASYVGENVASQAAIACEPPTGRGTYMKIKCKIK